MNPGMLEGKTILITGGTGSFGHAMCQRFLCSAIREVRIFSRDEKKQEDMRLRFGDARMKFYIGDVRDYGSVLEAMQGADFVFHAAALKQVPSCEFYPLEAVRTNVLGTENTLNAAIACGIDCVVTLSTDKAVYPISAMGLSKALMEKLMIARSRSAGRTVLCATRYGNVMASRGSVIPLFVRQLKEGRELTVTDPAMTRFLMSLEDSVDLTLYAYAHAQQGDIFVKKAPACTVADLAEAVRIVFDRANPIRVIGTRHGEKRSECLVSREEMARAEDLGTFYRIPAEARDLNYSKFLTEGDVTITTATEYASHNTRRLDLAEVVELLQSLDYVRRELRGEPSAEVA
jgi:UDP-N-acetylglucosamine 4,6-dehydratase/5-epimerase